MLGRVLQSEGNLKLIVDDLHVEWRVASRQRRIGKCLQQKLLVYISTSPELKLAANSVPPALSIARPL
jgi:hypothetical protein